METESRTEVARDWGKDNTELKFFFKCNNKDMFRHAKYKLTHPSHSFLLFSGNYWRIYLGKMTE